MLTLGELTQGHPHTHNFLWVSRTQKPGSLSYSWPVGFSDPSTGHSVDEEGRAERPPPGTGAGKVTPAQMAGVSGRGQGNVTLPTNWQGLERWHLQCGGWGVG